MKKRARMIRRTLSLLLAAAMLSTGVPVWGAEGFTDGFADEVEESETDIFLPGEEEAQEILTDEGESNAAEMLTFSDEEAPEGIHYVKGRPLTEEEKAAELAPFQNLTELGEAPVVGSELGISSYALYPTKFDNRANGLVTGAKNQHPFGICWAFGMASVLETSLLAQKKGAYDLSEEHLAYFFSNRENDPLNNTAGDYNYNTAMDYDKQGYHEGGNDMLASIFLTTWSGMTTEKSVPLPTDASHTENLSNEMVPSASKAYEAAACLTDASFSDYSIDRMKEMVMKDGSVAIMYYMDSSYYNPDTGGYCYPAVHKINHVVTVVGWDDTYSKANFPEKCGVTSDGAWIVKNSWGDKWGEDGFFYLSYEDAAIRGLVSAKAMDKPAYPNNYFYDGSSGLKSLVLEKKGQSAANIFTAKAKKDYIEAVGEVNVITYSDNAHYSVQIYTDLKDPADPTSGKTAYATPVDVYQPISGVKTIRVPEVKVAYGSMYSVVITNQDNALMKLCVEGNIKHEEWFSGHAEVKTGQGFFGSTTGKWTDLVKNSVTPRIKAHTRTLNETAAPILKGKVTSYNKVNLTWTKVSGISGYYLYRSEAGKAKQRIKTLSASSTAYSNGSLKTGVKYTYTLVPYRNVGGKAQTGKASNAVSLTPVLSKPVFEAKASNYGYNVIEWKKISGATEYQIYRKTGPGKLGRIATVKSTVTKYKDTKVTPCETYSYTVRAVRKSSGKTYLSKYTVGEAIKAAPATQKVSSVTGSTSGIRVKWKTQSKCDGYVLYRKTKTGSWKKIKTFSSRSTSTYLDKTVSKGVLYYYAVKAYVKEPYGTVCSRYTASSAVKRK